MKKRIFIPLVAAAVLLGMTACDNFEDINTDPTSIKYGNAKPLSLIQDIIHGGNWTILYHSVKLNSDLMQYSVYIESGEQISNYIVKPDESKDIWNGIAPKASACQRMYELAEKAGDYNCMAIALTLKAYFVSQLTDIFGDIPYSEAFKAESGNVTPKYDTQKEIYTSLLTELESANSMYDMTAALDSPQKDLLYQGDVAKWKKFTNSLRLRLLMRVSRHQDMNAPAEMRKMLDDPGTYPVFENNEDGAILRFTGVIPNINGYGPAGTLKVKLHSNRRMCSTLVDLMNLSSDPRTGKFVGGVASPANSKYLGQYRGIPSGYDYGELNVWVGEGASSYSETLETNTQPSTFMSFAELNFILAEAAFRGFIEGDPVVWYERGVTASVQEWCGADQKTDNLLKNTATKYDPSRGLEMIMEQKYIASFLVGFEAWDDYRRTGLPALTIGPAAQNKDAQGVAHLPERLIYPVISQSTNNKNYNEAVSRMGGRDDMLTKVWWAEGEY